ncbi:ATP-binding protein [Fontimonas sp. SYSU GA230001]|uniref:ATP-binding protein n=1 Tax=Fontimonas sp. SYSU GA230001 TaxID=3142450 RepID=UPI0032B32CCA
MTAKELFERLQLLDETERIEAKSASEIGKSVLETVCAYANEPGLGGGWLLLGVSRDESALFPSYCVTGIEQPDKLAADLASQLATVFNLAVRAEVRSEELAGKPVLVVFVPEAQPADKPIYFKAQGLPKGAFRRVGSTDQRCTEDDLVVFYAGRQHEGFDSSIIPDAGFEDFSPEAIAEYRNARRQISPHAEELDWSDEELLQALGALRRDGRGAWRPTVAGVILFGKPSALRRLFPMTRVDYIRVPGREWMPDPERRFETIELRDPLLRLVRRVQAAILDDLPKAFGLAEGEVQRQELPVMPARVIREAVVNALMHRSYRAHAPVQIVRYSNRLEIRNPGFSLKSPEHLGEPGSVPRNPRIAAALYDAGLAETKGSGVRVMREMCERAGLAPPLIESDRGQDQFVLRLFFHHFLGPADLAWLARFKTLHLSEADARALVVAREVGVLDNATYREINHVDTLTASQALRRLRDAGLLDQQGRGSATWYRPTDLMLGEYRPETGALEAGQDGEVALPREWDHQSRELEPLSRESDAQNSLDNSQAEARRALLAELPGDLAARVGALGKRGAPSAVQAVVLDLLRLRPWRAEALGLLLGRNPEYVRQKYLQPLIEAGRITMTRPDRNDPAQAYRTVDPE